MNIVSWKRDKRRFLLRLGLMLVALAFAASYFVVALPRVLYPYALDFIEEGIMMQALRVAQGLPVYVAPSADYVPTVYAPLYPWLGGLLLSLSGPHYLPLRLLSLLATVITAVLIYLIPRRVGSDPLVALSGTALFLAGYRIGGGWYELARVDPLFVALTLMGMFVAASRAGSRRGLATAGLLMALAIWTKQNGLLPALIVGAYFAWVAGRRAWVYAATLGLAVGLPALALQVASRGWFLTYVLHLAYDTPLDLGRFLRVTFMEIPGTMTVMLICALLYAGLLWGEEGWRALWRRPWPLFMAAGLAVTIASRTNVGGNLNTLILGYGLLCLAPGLLSAHLARRQATLPPRAPTLLLLALLPQFLLTLFNPLPNVPPVFVPTPQMRVAGDRFVRGLAATEGDVWVMMHPFYAVLAGKEPRVHVHALWHARARARQPLPADLVARLEGQYYELIVSDESLYERDPQLQGLVKQYYEAEELPAEVSPPTLSGPIVRPRLVYRPR